MSTIPMHRPSEPWARNALRLLGMVHELHKQGYQRLRIYSGIAPSGVFWRCTIHPKDLDEQERDRMDACEPATALVARYTTGDDRNYFQWKDCAQDDARALGQKFLQRFPALAGMGFGRDWAYAGWFTEILGHAEHGHFPVSYWDAMSEASEQDMKRAVWLKPGDGVAFPLAPPEGKEADYRSIHGSRK